VVESLLLVMFLRLHDVLTFEIRRLDGEVKEPRGTIRSLVSSRRFRGVGVFGARPISR
jgi:hypothetical protein